MGVMLKSGPIVPINILILELEWKNTFNCERDFLELGKVTRRHLMAVNNLTLTEADVAVCRVTACLV